MLWLMQGWCSVHLIIVLIYKFNIFDLFLYFSYQRIVNGWIGNPLPTWWSGPSTLSQEVSVLSCDWIRGWPRKPFCSEGTLPGGLSKVSMSLTIKDKHLLMTTNLGNLLSSSNLFISYEVTVRDIAYPCMLKRNTSQQCTQMTLLMLGRWGRRDIWGPPLTPSTRLHLGHLK